MGHPLLPDQLPLAQKISAMQRSAPEGSPLPHSDVLVSLRLGLATAAVDRSSVSQVRFRTYFGPSVLIVSR